MTHIAIAAFTPKLDIEKIFVENKRAIIMWYITTTATSILLIPDLNFSCME